MTLEKIWDNHFMHTAKFYVLKLLKCHFLRKFPSREAEPKKWWIGKILRPNMLWIKLGILRDKKTETSPKILHTKTQLATSLQLSTFFSIWRRVLPTHFAFRKWSWFYETKQTCCLENITELDKNMKMYDLKKYDP